MRRAALEGWQIKELSARGIKAKWLPPVQAVQAIGVLDDEFDEVKFNETGSFDWWNDRIEAIEK